MALPRVTMSEPFDAARLATSIAAGDEDAFILLFRTFGQRLYRYLDAYVRSHEDAENLLQDLFLWLWRHREQLTGVRDLESYLYSAARHRALDHLRRRRVQDREGARHLVAAPASSSPEGEREIAVEELAAAVRHALDTLPPRQREVFLLRWRGEASYQQIADELGLAVKTVENHLRLAAKHLRRTLTHLL
jgi:RNA polymerase sigma-70 factor (family 1)